MEMVEMMEMMEMSEPEPVGWGVGHPALLGPPLALDGGEGPVPVPQAEVIRGVGHPALLGPVLRL